MGMYVNPGNEGFEGIVSGEYVDKTGLIAAADHYATIKELLSGRGLADVVHPPTRIA